MKHPSTEGADYARRLTNIQDGRWRRLLNVQAPYRWNIRRLAHGFTLEVGAGIGRNLLHLDGRGVGVDHNAEAVRIMREKGLQAYRPDDFSRSEFARADAFDNLLFAHVLEHMTIAEGRDLIAQYLPYIRKGGSVIVITPQQWGYASDATHVTYIDFDRMDDLLRELQLDVQNRFSFPFPRCFGKIFKYNEFVVVARI